MRIRDDDDMPPARRSRFAHVVTAAYKHGLPSTADGIGVARFVRR